MDRVSTLLGHSSIKVTEKHYSPWVRARQQHLETDVRGTWEAVLPEKKGPPNVQEKRESVN
jgi:integrase